MKRLRAVALGSLLASGRWACVSQDRGGARGAREHRRSRSLFDELVRDSTAAAIVTPFEQKAVWENGRDHTRTRASTSIALSPARSRAIRGCGRWAGPSASSGRSSMASPCSRSASPGCSSCSRDETSGGGVYAVTARAQGQFPVVASTQEDPQRFVRSSGAAGSCRRRSARVAQMAQLRAKAGLAPRSARARPTFSIRGGRGRRAGRRRGVGPHPWIDDREAPAPRSWPSHRRSPRLRSPAARATPSAGRRLRRVPADFDPIEGC